MTNSRRTTLYITYNHSNATEVLAANTRSWTYTDNLSGQIDDLQLELEDIEHLWLNDWFPSKGSIIIAAIGKMNWLDKEVKTKLGKFEVDEIEGSGPPSIVKIKALSVPETSSIRGEEKSRAWENTTLKVVAGDIAKKNNLKLYYQASENPKKERFEQESETDLSFLHKLCNDEGFCLKLSNDSIVILDEADYENNAVVATINRKSNENDVIQVIRWSGRTTLSGTYNSAILQYHDSGKKKTIKASFKPAKAPKVGRTLVIKDKVKSVAEGQRLCKKKLRDANKNATTISLTVVSEKHLDAGMTVKLQQFGKFDGKYIITQVVHSQGSVSLQLRRCLEGY